MTVSRQILIFTLLLFSVVANGQKALFVDPGGNDINPGSLEKPIKSLQHAIDKAAELGVENVQLRAGTYHLEKPLIFKPKHSGVHLTNYNGEKVVISGGREITGWKMHKKDLWVTEIPDVKSGQWDFRQIYVDAKLRHRARKPNQGFLTVAGMPDGTPGTVHYHTDCQRFEFYEGDIDPNWSNLDDVEVIVYHFWTDSHLPIESIDDKTNIVTFRHKAGKVFTDDFSENGARYIVENVLEELDAPGEWYLDRTTGKCFYFPYPDEKLGNVEIYAPVAPELIRVEGEPASNKFVDGINLENIEFFYTNWQMPPGNSNDQQGSASVPAAITLKGARNCSITRCSFRNLGTWAFELKEGCKDNLFSGNQISNIAAGGFRVSGGNYQDHIFLRTSGNEISYNRIQQYGQVYPSAVGILLQHTEGNLVSHNHIRDGYYTGISVGWNWGYQRSISRDNVIEYNHIHDIGKGLLSDMGAIYTLGVSPGTIIRNNLIHDVDANHYGGWGIYHDEGSTHILVENNVVFNTKFAAFNIHFCKEVTVRNNIFALGKLQQLSRSRMEPHQSVYFEQNIVYWREGELLDNRWQDQPYDFYFHPKNDQGTREVTSTFAMDYNLYFNPEKSLDNVQFNGKSWEEWQKLGKDQHSIYADPGFRDPENGDFSFTGSSPAFKLGFVPIDTKEIGLNGKEVGPEWEAIN